MNRLREYGKWLGDDKNTPAIQKFFAIYAPITFGIGVTLAFTTDNALWAVLAISFLPLALIASLISSAFSPKKVKTK